nr:MAG TPA: hypothetical protein [Caudoviricetes sp.]
MTTGALLVRMRPWIYRLCFIAAGRYLNTARQMEKHTGADIHSSG